MYCVGVSTSEIDCISLCRWVEARIQHSYSRPQEDIGAG